MPSPFPGMDPYLEGYLWPDVHQALAGKIRQQLTPLVRPRYTARLAVYVVEDSTPELEVGIMYPDVEVLRTDATHEPSLPTPPLSAASTAFQPAPTPASLILPILTPVEVQIVRVEIRDTAGNQLVTCIEILSSVNKGEPGLTAYRRKRQRLYQVGVHLLELDLLRRGSRPLAHPRLPAAAYLLTLTRAHAGVTEVWPLAVRDTLPLLPIPLLSPDADVILDLPAALTAIYEEAAYDLSIDYAQPPPPPEFSEVDQQWMHTVLGWS
jgi:Protein of unknown function (DUF4058)